MKTTQKYKKRKNRYYKRKHLPRVKDTATFILIASIIHNNKFDYSKTVFTGKKNTITLTCPVHGDITINAGSHLLGTNCEQCTYEQNKQRQATTLEEFKNKFNYKYQGRYLFKDDDFISISDKINIYCIKHNEYFTQKPKDSLVGLGCKRCTKEKASAALTLNLDEFEAKVMSAYNNKPNFKIKSYINMSTSVLINCEVHGEVSVHPTTLIRGKGCPKCSMESVTLKMLKRNLTNNINKATILFNGKYDYSYGTFLGVTKPYKMICPEHGEFYRSFTVHLRGCGCPKCPTEKVYTEYMNRKKTRRKVITTDIFKEHVRNIHGNKYGLDKVIYTGIKNKVEVYCPKHDKYFTIIAEVLLRGAGCILCGREKTVALRKITFEEWLASLVEKREDMGTYYDYSKAEFSSTKKKILIICPTHGEFWQTPSNHALGQNCPKCARVSSARKNAFTTEEIIRLFQEVHGDRYDYSKVTYTNMKTDITIICPIHGAFKQLPETHLTSKIGCSSCGDDLVASLLMRPEKEIFEAILNLYGDKYGLDLADYTGMSNRMKIICSEHGIVEVIPNSFIRGSGCPKCSGSTGEKYISSILHNLNVEFIREYVISGYRYRYDFFLKKYNIFIEYHGSQHYEAVKFFGGEEAFIRRKEMDLFKSELIKEHGGKLITLNYKDKEAGVLKEKLISQLLSLSVSLTTLSNNHILE